MKFQLILKDSITKPSKSAIDPRTPFSIAIIAINTRSIAPTFTASLRPSVVPLAIASKILEPIFSLETDTIVLISSVCGNSILEITIAPGAAITDAANKCLA